MANFVSHFEKWGRRRCRFRPSWHYLAASFFWPRTFGYTVYKNSMLKRLINLISRRICLWTYMQLIYDSKPRTSFFAHERMYASLLENQCNGDLNVLLVKLKIFQKVAWIRTNHLHLQWKFKLWVGKFTWDVKAKHCWALSTNFRKLP